MDESVKIINVFVASPGDVKSEREQLSGVIAEVNDIVKAIAPEKRVVLDLISWEKDVYPDMSSRGPQGVVDEQLPEYDIFIGIMWKHFGTPTRNAGSGTEAEFNTAYSKWEKNNFPLLFFFCQDPSTQKTVEEANQYVKVLQFRENLSKKGLVKEYDKSGFAYMIRKQLFLVLGRIFAKGGTIATSEEVKELTTKNDIAAARNQVLPLSKEYDELRITMRSGNERTSLMTVIESKMRAIASQIFPLLSELTESVSAGDRLAAIAALKEIPDPNYLTWLANRVGSSEKPFVGFQASLGLLLAARVLGASYNMEVKTAIDLATNNLSKSSFKDPNQVSVLKSAMIEINRNS